MPSYTSRLSGYSRVLSCAEARAVELLSTVCVVGCFGDLSTANGTALQSTAACVPRESKRSRPDTTTPGDPGDATPNGATAPVPAWKNPSRASTLQRQR